MSDAFSGQWKDLAAAFLKLGIMSYGGSAMMGIMHAEVVEQRRWLSDARYLEGVGLVTMLPGPPAVQLAIFVGYARAGWRGGILTEFCFMLPAFFQLLGLTLLYSAYGSIGVIQGALYGMGPVVLAIFIAAVYRLGRSTFDAPGQVAIAVVAGVLVAYTPFGIVATLLAAGCAALALGRHRVQGLIAGLVVIAAFALIHWLQDVPALALSPIGGPVGSDAPSLQELAVFFLKVGAFTY
ncbi:MAG: chromate transporter [Betaproteobacteria bacterium]|nr:chromate transporter [Betaproteobacteria bacterium]